ncbi:hypothetical protein ACM66B_000906 [Microbotryomycetes sp. NB124-2]
MLAPLIIMIMCIQISFSAPQSVSSDIGTAVWAANSFTSSTVNLRGGGAFSLSFKLELHLPDSKDDLSKTICSVAVANSSVDLLSLVNTGNQMRVVDHAAGRNDPSCGRLSGCPSISVATFSSQSPITTHTIVMSRSSAHEELTINYKVQAGERILLQYEADFVAGSDQDQELAVRFVDGDLAGGLDSRVLEFRDWHASEVKAA